MTRLGTALALILASAFAVLGCGRAKQTAMPHAVYANQVPIYPGAVLQDAMGSTSVGDTPESATDGMAWFFEVKASSETMRAFYEKKLPGATQDPEWTSGVRLVWVPKGAAPGERVEIILEDNSIQIGESVKPGKRAGNPNEFSQGLATEVAGAAGESSDGP
jgi:hypothetical protein